MKKFIEKKWFPPMAVLTGILVIGFILFFCGFRITYAPEMENSWDAVSAVAAWVGVLISALGVAASFLAIWYAIQVPQKIADRQDKIALFEKRYECYSVIQNLLTCARQIENIQINIGIQVAFGTFLDQPERITPQKIIDENNSLILALKLNQQGTIATSGAFLFSSYNTELLQKIIDVGFNLILATAECNTSFDRTLLSESSKQLKIQYCELCKQYSDTYIELMEKELQLNADKLNDDKRGDPPCPSPNPTTKTPFYSSSPRP